MVLTGWVTRSWSQIDVRRFVDSPLILVGVPLDHLSH